MSWEIELAGLFRDRKHPIVRFLEIVDLLKNDSYISHIHSLSIYESFEDVIPSVELNLDSTVNIDSLSSILKPYQEMVGIRVEGIAIAAQRYFFNSENDKLEMNGYRVSLNLPGKSGSGRILEEDCSLVYKIGNSRFFSTQVNEEMAYMNFKGVLCEISSLARLGIKSLSATSMEDDEVKSCFFIYHDEVSEFLYDIYKNIDPNDFLFGIIKDDIKKVSQQNDLIDHYEIDRGIAVYDTRIIEGDLRLFFANLKKYLDA